MFQKILAFLDFAKGWKSIVAAFALIISTIFATKGIDVTQVELVELFNALVDNAYVIVSAISLVYGLVMKIVRKFN